MTNVIETHHLRKEYGDKVAVADLTLQIERGEVFGFLGPNGAGKTTVVKMLLGLAAPTAGTAQVLGRPLGDTSIRARIGFLPEHFRFHEWLQGAEFLDLHGQLLGLTAGQRAKRIPRLLNLVELGDAAGRRLSTFSKGMLQRIGLAQALLPDPDLVILDEPTSGLDPLGRRLVRDVIHQLKAAGTAVFLNSHLLSEVEVTCDRVAFIKEGRIVRTARLGALVEGLTEVVLQVGQVTPELLEGLRRWSQDLRVDGRRITMTIQDEEILPHLSQWVVDQRVGLYALTPQQISLEELFVRVVEAQA
ncbi:MAG: ATP-binding cassette domain-containing protein [Ardenticatenales bacterium]|nr:ATP-binding cassette domain-containing protein [Ardenticatenales bacterium]